MIIDTGGWEVDVDELGIAVDHAPPCAVIRVAGELDLATAPALAQAIRAAAVEGGRHIVLDLTDVSFIDSSGLAVLIAARHDLGPRGLAIARPQLRVARTLATSGLVHLIEVHDTVDLATYMLTGEGDPRADGA